MTWYNNKNNTNKAGVTPCKKRPRDQANFNNMPSSNTTIDESEIRPLHEKFPHLQVNNRPSSASTASGAAEPKNRMVVGIIKDHIRHLESSSAYKLANQLVGNIFPAMNDSLAINPRIIHKVPQTIGGKNYFFFEAPPVDVDGMEEDGGVGGGNKIVLVDVKSLEVAPAENNGIKDRVSEDDRQRGYPGSRVATSQTDTEKQTQNHFVQSSNVRSSMGSFSQKGGGSKYGPASDVSFLEDAVIRKVDSVTSNDSDCMDCNPRNPNRPFSRKQLGSNKQHLNDEEVEEIVDYTKNQEYGSKQLHVERDYRVRALPPDDSDYVAPNGQHLHDELNSSPDIPEQRMGPNEAAIQADPVTTDLYLNVGSKIPKHKPQLEDKQTSTPPVISSRKTMALIRNHDDRQTQTAVSLNARNPSSVLKTRLKKGSAYSVRMTIPKDTPWGPYEKSPTPHQNPPALTSSLKMKRPKRKIDTQIRDVFQYHNSKPISRCDSNTSNVGFISNNTGHRATSCALSKPRTSQCKLKNWISDRARKQSVQRPFSKDAETRKEGQRSVNSRCTPIPLHIQLYGELLSRATEEKTESRGPITIDWSTLSAIVSSQTIPNPYSDTVTSQLSVGLNRESTFASKSSESNTFKPPLPLNGPLQGTLFGLRSSEKDYSLISRKSSKFACINEDSFKAEAIPEAPRLYKRIPGDTNCAIESDKATLRGKCTETNEIMSLDNTREAPLLKCANNSPDIRQTTSGLVASLETYKAGRKAIAAGGSQNQEGDFKEIKRKPQALKPTDSLEMYSLRVGSRHMEAGQNRSRTADPQSKTYRYRSPQAMTFPKVFEPKDSLEIYAMREDKDLETKAWDIEENIRFSIKGRYHMTSRREDPPQLQLSPGGIDCETEHPQSPGVQVVITSPDRLVEKCVHTPTMFQCATNTSDMHAYSTVDDTVECIVACNPNELEYHASENCYHRPQQAKTDALMTRSQRVTVSNEDNANPSKSANENLIGTPYRIEEIKPSAETSGVASSIQDSFMNQREQDIPPKQDQNMPSHASQMAEVTSTDLDGTSTWEESGKSKRPKNANPSKKHHPEPLFSKSKTASAITHTDTNSAAGKSATASQPSEEITTRGQQRFSDSLVTDGEPRRTSRHSGSEVLKLPELKERTPSGSSLRRSVKHLLTGLTGKAPSGLEGFEPLPDESNWEIPVRRRKKKPDTESDTPDPTTNGGPSSARDTGFNSALWPPGYAASQGGTAGGVCGHHNIPHVCQVSWCQQPCCPNQWGVDNYGCPRYLTNPAQLQSAQALKAQECELLNDVKMSVSMPKAGGAHFFSPNEFPTAARDFFSMENDGGGGSGEGGVAEKTFLMTTEEQTQLDRALKRKKNKTKEPKIDKLEESSDKKVARLKQIEKVFKQGMKGPDDEEKSANPVVIEPDDKDDKASKRDPVDDGKRTSIFDSNPPVNRDVKKHKKAKFKKKDTLEGTENSENPQPNKQKKTSNKKIPNEIAEGSGRIAEPKAVQLDDQKDPEDKNHPERSRDAGAQRDRVLLPVETATNTESETTGGHEAHGNDRASYENNEVGEDPPRSVVTVIALVENDKQRSPSEPKPPKYRSKLETNPRNDDYYEDSSTADLKPRGVVSWEEEQSEPTKSSNPTTKRDFSPPKERVYREGLPISQSFGLSDAQQLDGNDKEIVPSPVKPLKPKSAHRDARTRVPEQPEVEINSKEAEHGVEPVLNPYQAQVDVDVVGDDSTAKPLETPIYSNEDINADGQQPRTPRNWEELDEEMDAKWETSKDERITERDIGAEEDQDEQPGEEGEAEEMREGDEKDDLTKNRILINLEVINDDKDDKLVRKRGPTVAELITEDQKPGIMGLRITVHIKDDTLPEADNETKEMMEVDVEELGEAHLSMEENRKTLEADANFEEEKMKPTKMEDTAKGREENGGEEQQEEEKEKEHVERETVRRITMETTKELKLEKVIEKEEKAEQEVKEDIPTLGSPPLYIQKRLWSFDDLGKLHFEGAEEPLAKIIAPEPKGTATVPEGWAVVPLPVYRNQRALYAAYAKQALTS